MNYWGDLFVSLATILAACAAIFGGGFLATQGTWLIAWTLWIVGVALMIVSKRFQRSGNEKFQQWRRENGLI